MVDQMLPPADDGSEDLPEPVDERLWVVRHITYEAMLKLWESHASARSFCERT